VKRTKDQKSVRDSGAEEAANDPFVQGLEYLAKLFNAGKIPTGMRFMEANDPTNNQSRLPQNLDVPVEPDDPDGFRKH
jgi:hypothetical protein